MATMLTKDVKRETYSVFDRKGRKQIVTLKAGDMLEFRGKGKQKTIEVPLAACMNLAMIYEMNELYKERMKEYKAKKAAGQRVRKPRRPGRVFSKAFYDALEKKPHKR